MNLVPLCLWLTFALSSFLLLPRLSDDRLPFLLDFYKELHRSPELSLHEEKTAARLAAEMRRLGFTVTENIGGFGVVAELQNGAGPTILVRTDMDALPILEQTDLPYASRVRALLEGRDLPVMHACGHDLHMTVWIGAAAELASTRERWSGRLLFIAQPAEEKGLGARAMLDAGLFRRFGKPDFALALHASATHPAGTVALASGPVLAGAESCEITLKGRGGHGSAPHNTIDPVVLAARVVLGLQTVISRERDPRTPAVITVGSIHGGSKHNIIPDEVKLELTLRSYDDEVHAKLKAGIARTCKGEAIAAGAPDPEIKYLEGTPPTHNDPALCDRLRKVFRATLGEQAVIEAEPVMGAEDFSHYGREGVPAVIFWLGAVPAQRHAESRKPGGAPLPSLHSSAFAPDPEPAIRTGVAAMSAAVRELAVKQEKK